LTPLVGCGVSDLLDGIEGAVVDDQAVEAAEALIGDGDEVLG
jgi:hypothetical protein